MKHRDFEDFLMDKFASTDGNCVLDDDMPDAFDDWICNLEVDEWLEYGEKYKEECVGNQIKLNYYKNAHNKEK